LKCEELEDFIITPYSSKASRIAQQVYRLFAITSKRTYGFLINSGVDFYRLDKDRKKSGVDEKMV